jgi:hypothetical protein
MQLLEFKKVLEDNIEVTIPHAEEKLARRAREAALQRKVIDSRATLGGGGWCLHEIPAEQYVTHGTTNIKIPRFLHLLLPPKRIVTELSEMIRRENITPINDFGAGVGQYKADILAKHPQVDYQGYDGAGNVVPYTKGFLEYADDLTYPGYTKGRLGIILGSWRTCS